MGCIASPLSDRSPMAAIRELWGGELPPFDAIEDFNHLLHVLMDGLWNCLTAHQAESNPFRLTPLALDATRDGLNRSALVRKEEIEGFMEGMFGSHEEINLPEAARASAEVLEEVAAMLAATISLLDDPSKPASPGDLKGLRGNIERLTRIVEKEMNTVILSCTRGRKHAGAAPPPTKLIVH